MNKIRIMPLVLLSSVFGFGQVGINTETPQASLEISAKNPTTNATTKEGILIPRVSRLRAQSITSPIESTLIYINNISNGSLTGTTIDVTSIGFYYFNGTKWVKINNSTDDVHIYNNNGVLSNNRTVAQAGNTLNFTSTATMGTSHFTIDGNTLNVDAVNNRVGIGTSTPQTSLHVTGALQLTNSLNVGGTATTGGSSGTSGQILVSKGNNAAPIWQTSAAITPVVFGNLDRGTSFYDISANNYLKDKIVLTKGKWLVYVGRLLRTAGTASSTNNIWVRLTLSDSETGNTNVASNFTFLSSTLVSSWLSEVNESGGNNFTFLSGVIPVEIKVDSLTLYLRTREFTSIGSGLTIRTKGDFGENYLFAIPTN